MSQQQISATRQPSAGSRSAVRAAILAFAFTCFAACDGCGRQQPEPSVPAPQLDAWAFTRDAQAWAWFDIVTLRADPRMVRVWEAAGPAIEAGPVVDLQRADSILLTWRDPTFSQRVNVVTGSARGLPPPEQLEADGFQAYRAGPHSVWSRGSGGWAFAAPQPDLLVTGTPSAVRGVVSAPCDGCTQGSHARTPGAVLVAELRVTDELRRVATFALTLGAIDRALAELATVRAQVVLGLGADVLVQFTPREGVELSFVSVLLVEVLDALRDVLRRAPEAAFASALLERAELHPRDSELELSVEIARDELDALLAMIADLDRSGASDHGAAPSADMEGSR